MLTFTKVHWIVSQTSNQNLELVLPCYLLQLHLEARGLQELKGELR